MKQQHTKQPFTAKKMSRTAMKAIKGGKWGGGLWVCVSDGYRCSLYQWECEQTCSDPSYCLWADYCP